MCRTPLCFWRHTLWFSIYGVVALFRWLPATGSVSFLTQMEITQCTSFFLTIDSIYIGRWSSTKWGCRGFWLLHADMMQLDPGWLVIWTFFWSFSILNCPIFVYNVIVADQRRVSPFIWLLEWYWKRRFEDDFGDFHDLDVTLDISYIRGAARALSGRFL